MTQRTFDPTQCARIAAAYNAPERPSLRVLGERYHADHHVIAKAIRDAGGTVRSGNPKRYKVANICNDWNSDIPADRICRVYGVPNVKALHANVSYWRRCGWDFKKRQSGRQNKRFYTVTQSTKYELKTCRCGFHGTLKELTDGESITAGCIAQGGAK